MYDVYREGGTHTLISSENGAEEAVFSRPHTQIIIDTLLTRRERNNGVGRALMSQLRNSGSCTHYFASKRSVESGFTCSQLPAHCGAYFMRFLGSEYEPLLNRLNRSRRMELACEITRRERELRRKLRAQGIYLKRPKNVPAVAGANGDLVRHFKNTAMKFEEAVTAIAHATSFSRERVVTELQKSLRERGTATLRVSHGFVFRIDFVHALSANHLLSMTAEVTLRSTKDNTHPVYRRLRKKLKILLNCESKARKRAKEHYEEARRWRRVNRILFA